MFTARSRPILRPVLASAFAAAVLFGAAASALAAGVADYVPSDALVVIKVNKLQSVSDKAGKLMKDLGIAEMNPDAADPLAFLQRDSGLSKGVDAKGDFAIYVANAHFDGFKDSDDDQPPLVALVPVSDYKAFIGSFKDVQEVGDGMSSGSLPEGDGTTLYMMKMGEFAVISSYQDLVKKPDTSIQFEGRHRQATRRQGCRRLRQLQAARPDADPAGEGKGP